LFSRRGGELNDEAPSWKRESYGRIVHLLGFPNKLVHREWFKQEINRVPHG